METNPERQPEDEEPGEGAAQEFELSQSAPEEPAGPIAEAAEAAEVLEGEILESDTGVPQDTTGEMESSWQPEPIDYSNVPVEPAPEAPPETPGEPAFMAGESGPEIPPPSPAWQPEAAARSESEAPRPVPPVPPVPPAPPRLAAERLSNEDERTWALLAHLSVLLNLVTGILGPVAAIVIYFAFKDRSKYVAYHAMQSFIFQLLWWIGAGILAAVLWVFVGLLAVVQVGLCLIPVALVASLLPLGALVYGVIGAIQVNQGRDFRYWLIGDWVRGELTGD